MATLEERIAALEQKLGTLTPRRFPQGVDQVAVLNMLDKVLVGVNADGSAKVAAVNQIANLISATVGSGIEPTVEPDTVLPAPAQAGKIMIMKGGNYTQPDETTPLVAPANSFNVGYWDGEEWSIDISIETEADLSDYLKSEDILPDKSPYTLRFEIQVNVTQTGGDVANPGYVSSDFIPIDDTLPIILKRGVNSGLSLPFYDSNFDYIGYRQGTAGESEVFTPISGSFYVKTNISTNSDTWLDDIAAFGLYQKNPATALVDRIEGLGILAEDIKDRSSFIGKESIKLAGPIDNLYSVGQVEDDTYVHSSGNIGSGSSNPSTDFAMARIPISAKNTHISWLRESTTATFGYFFDQYHRPIVGITGMGSVFSGTNEVPANAAWLYVNVSNDPLKRSLEKNRLTVVYGEVVLIDHLPQRSLTAIASTLISHPFSGLKGIAIGDSITTYERVGESGQNTDSNYFVRACSQIGALMLENYSIGGSTISQRVSDPTERDPISIRYADMRDDADFVMVSAGTNDCTHGWTTLGTFSDSTVNTFYGALHVLCQGLRAKYVGKYVFFLTPIRRYADFAGMTTPDSPNAAGETPQQYVDAIIEVCGYYGIPVMDRFRTCRLWPFIEEYRIQFMNDGTHPNADGHIIMANDLVDWLAHI